MICISNLSNEKDVKEYVKSLDLNIGYINFNFGNKILDIIISEKYQLCKDKGIRFDIVADFSNMMDLCVIFSNALDNAIEACDKILDDSKDKYVASVIDRFGSRQNYSDIEKLLLCDTQKDENCKYIILVSRLNDLLIGKYDGLFSEYYAVDSGFAQTVADTRHYYTHYGKSKEKKALKGDKLIDAIGILALLLEYNVCLQLGIDNQAKVRERLSSIASWKKFHSCYQKESKQTI